MGSAMVTVLVAALAYQVVGFAWYTQSLFGGAWMRLAGMKAKTGNQQGMATILALSTLAAVVTAYVLRKLFKYIGVNDPMGGALAGILLWAGLIAAMNVHGYLYKKQPMKLFLIEQGHQLVGLIVMGAILGAWR